MNTTDTQSRLETYNNTWVTHSGTLPDLYTLPSKLRPSFILWVKNYILDWIWGDYSTVITIISWVSQVVRKKDRKRRNIHLRYGYACEISELQVAVAVLRREKNFFTGHRVDWHFVVGTQRVVPNRPTWRRHRSINRGRHEAGPGGCWERKRFDF